MPCSSTISVLVLFTPEAAPRLGTKPRLSIQRVIDLQNRIFVNSGVDAKVVLCGAELLSEFKESEELDGDLSTTAVLEILQQTLDEDKFAVKKRRDKYAADIVSVWVELNGPDTIGSVAEFLSKNHFEQGATITAEQIFLNVIITAKAGEPLFHFAHELGHNMGLGHDIDGGPSSNPIFSFARGFVDTTVPPFRTVMASANACQNAGFDECPRIPFYSSADPRIRFNGRPVGIPNMADNARVLGTTIPFVAGYRNALFAPCLPGTLQEGVYTIQQKSNNRFVDAHEHPGKDFGLVSRPPQNNDTQRWLFTHLVNNVYTIQQLSNGRFVDAHDAEANKDFALVTRGAQDNDTQRWILTHLGDRTFTLQQKSSKRFMDAHEIVERDFALVTRTEQNNNTQRWIFTPITLFYTIQQVSNGRFVDAHDHSGKDFALVTREAQNNNTQRWTLTHLGNNTYTLQQKSSNRFMDAHEIMEKDFALVTRPEQNNNTQRWIIRPA